MEQPVPYLTHLRTDDGFGGEGDEVYAALLAAHESLSDSQSAALNARLVLLLANHIGDLSVIRQALSAARASVMKDLETQ
jgi:hypothetical protein